MLTFNVKKEWFNKIKSGEKTHEYREVKNYWYKRFFSEASSITIKNWYSYIENLAGASITFKCGYPKKDDKDKILKAKIKSIKIINGKSTDLKINKPVYDIEFELTKEK